MTGQNQSHLEKEDEGHLWPFHYKCYAGAEWISQENSLELFLAMQSHLKQERVPHPQEINQVAVLPCSPKLVFSPPSLQVLTCCPFPKLYMTRLWQTWPWQALSWAQVDCVIKGRVNKAPRFHFIIPFAIKMERGYFSVEWNNNKTRLTGSPYVGKRSLGPYCTHPGSATKKGGEAGPTGNIIR